MNTAPSSAPTANETSREIQLAESASVSAAAAVAMTPPAIDAARIDASVLTATVPGHSAMRRAPCGRFPFRADTSGSARHRYACTTRRRRCASRRRARGAAWRAPRDRQATCLRASGLKCARTRCIAVAIGVVHIGAHFERAGPMRGTDPRRDFRRGTPQRLDGRFEHARREPAPARVRDADDRARAIAEEHRQAVGRAHRDAGRPRVRVTAASAGRRARSARVRVDSDARRPVYLRQPDRIGGQAPRASARRARRSPRVVNSARMRARSLPLRDDEAVASSHARAAAAISAARSAGTRRLATASASGRPDARGRGAARAAPGAGTRALRGPRPRPRCAGRDRSDRRSADVRAAARCTRIWCVRPVSSLHRTTRRERHALDDFDVRARGLAALDHGHRRALRRMTSDRRIDGACCARRRRATTARYSRVTVRAASWRTRLGLRLRRSWQRRGVRSCPCRDGARCPPAEAPRAAARDAEARSAACRPGCRCPGCTTRPAGLSTTSSASSSNTIVQRDVLRGRRRRAPASPSSTASASPPASLWRGVVTTAPSTRTRPASIHARRRVRECSGRSSASVWSRRRPAAEAGAQAVARAAACRPGRDAIIRGWRMNRMQRLLSPVVVRALGRIALAALALSSCGLFPEVKDETATWSADRLYQTAHEAMLQGNYSRATKLFDQLEARYPVRPLRAAGHPRVGVRQLARERAGRRDRGGRPIHPHVSQPSQRRLRVLPEGPRPLPRGPGPHRLRLRARSVGARSEGDAQLVRGVQGAHGQVPGEPVLPGLDRAHALPQQRDGDLRGQGRELLLQARRIHRRRQSRAGRAAQLSADAGQREGARPPARELHQARHDAARRRHAADPRARRIPTAATSRA